MTNSGDVGGPVVPALSVTAGLDHLVRAEAPVVPPVFDVFEPAPGARRLWHVAGIARDEKFGAALERSVMTVSDAVKLPTIGLLSGMHGYGSPLAFVVTGSGGRVAVEIGVWTARRGTAPDDLDARADVLASALRSLYPVVHLAPSAGGFSPLPVADLVLGVPTITPPTSSDAVVPLDRVIRSLAGERFQVVVLAQPLARHQIDRMRDEVISEMRWVQVAAQAESLPSPLSVEYLEMLKRHLTSLTGALVVGAWRTAVYLAGDPRSLPQLETVWRSTFAGADSRPEPVRTHRAEQVVDWVRRWQLPQVAGPPSGTRLTRPFELQSVLTSDRLAAYIHLPEQEAPGFAVDATARFDSVAGPTVPAGVVPRATIAVGKVVYSGRTTGEDVTIPVDDLAKHALVCGVTGSGKSSTIRHILAALTERGVPFLVLEPAKAEYRALTRWPSLARTLRVFTVGDESVAPLRLNPLAAVEGTSVAMHLDLLKSLFGASFGLWAPLPQILERCLHELYTDYGWDLGDNSNRRLGEGGPWASAFPTLSELHTRVERHIAEIGYGGEVTANMRAALSTRIGGLTVGAKGRMLDGHDSIAPADLFDRPVVLELERVADPEDQAFLMGLLLVQLAEHRRRQGPSDTLRHLIVVEEAHRLLARSGGSGAEENGNPRAKAVESFANLLAELRSYGQGALIADQIPVKLAPEVIKNSNLKIVHRLVADDDRAALAGAMVMNDRQRRALATLDAGEAAVFSEGHDAPLLVRVPPGPRTSAPADRDLVVEGPAVDCAGACRGGPSCDDAAAALDDALSERVDRMIQSLLVDPAAVTRTRPEIVQIVRMRTRSADPAAVLSCVVFRAAASWASRRGAQYGWSFAVTRRIAGRLAAALAAPDGDTGSAIAFVGDVAAATTRHDDPYPRCGVVCPDRCCLHRYAAVPPRDEPGSPDWARVTALAATRVEFPSPQVDDATWTRLRDGGLRLSLCLGQQALLGDGTRMWDTRVRAVDDLIAQAADETGTDVVAAGALPGEPGAFLDETGAFLDEPGAFLDRPRKETVG